METKRRSVPYQVAAQLKFASGHRCCVCRHRGDVLHHLDGNPSNNEFENLAFLCFNCHDDATRTGGLRRKLTKADIVVSRDDWYERVKRHGIEWACSLPDDTPGRFSREELRTLTLDALAIDAIRDFDNKCQRDDWEKLKRDVKALFRYTDFRYGKAVRNELLSVLGGVTSLTREGMPYVTAGAVGGVISATLPIFNLVGKQTQLEGTTESELLVVGCSLGFDLAYDGLRWLQNLAVADVGLDILWIILRFAELNDLSEVRTSALEEFARLEEVAKQHVSAISEDALEWIRFKRDDALAVDFADAPPIPREIDERISKIKMRKQA